MHLRRWLFFLNNQIKIIIREENERERENESSSSQNRICMEQHTHDETIVNIFLNRICHLERKRREQEWEMEGKERKFLFFSLEQHK